MGRQPLSHQDHPRSHYCFALSRFPFSQSGRTLVALLLFILLDIEFSYFINRVAIFPSSSSTSSNSSHHSINKVLDKQGSLPPAHHSPEQRAVSTHWCIIAKGYVPRTVNSHFGHFPHAAEVLLPCWSYFRKHHVTEKCGFVLMDHFDFQEGSWQRQLVDAMGCHVKSFPHSIPPNYVGDGLRYLNDSYIPKEDVQHIPNMFLQRPRYPYIRYLDEEDDAHALRRLFVTDEEIASVKGIGKALQIGLLQRKGKRHITNMNEIQAGLQTALPWSEIHLTEFDPPPLLKDQATFATKDVIVTSHGAALFNSIFITKGTIVLQVWPDNWFWQSCDSLIEQSGGIALDWYTKGKHPVIAFESAKTTRAQYRGLDAKITPPVDEIVDRILIAMGKKPATRDTINNLRDELWRR